MNKRKTISLAIGLLITSFFSSSSHAIYDPLVTNTTPKYVPNQVIIKYKPEMSPLYLKSLATNPTVASDARNSAIQDYSQIRQFNQSLGITNTDTASTINDDTLIYKTDGEKTVDDIVTIYSKNDTVEYVEPNYYYSIMSTPNDPLFSQQWDMAKINMPTAWDKTKGLSSVKVAVIDSGIISTHPDLTGKVVDEKWFDTCTSKGDIVGHGTHVSGTIGAGTDNAVGVAGSGWNVGIMSLRASCDTKGGFTNAAIGLAIDYAINNGAKVINMSLGGTSPSNTMSSAVTRAVNSGITVVVASGNSGPGTADSHYPGSYSNVISVGATTNTDKIANFSSTGSTVDVSAPGVSIASTWKDNNYKAINGTSMAAPHVAGVVALMYSLNPSIKPSEVKSILENTAVDLGAPGRDSVFGAGRIDAQAALARVTGGSGTVPSPTAITTLPTPTSFNNPNPTNIPAPTNDIPQPTTSPGCPAGDYDCNGAVDKDDYNKWLTDFIAGNSLLRRFEEWRKAIYRGQ